MSTSDAAIVASICTLIGLIVQGAMNQWGAERARKHEFAMKRLELEEEHDEDEKRR